MKEFPFILADQNLAAAQLPFVFIMADADSVKNPKSVCVVLAAHLCYGAVAAEPGPRGTY